MQSIKEYISESKLNRVENKAYKDTLEVAKKAILKLLTGSGVVDKAIQLELKDWAEADVSLEKIESEVLRNLKDTISKIK